ncbi:hypothetical protein AAL_05581 [Moelleriella libera RCEF 2490]|uniref:Uncharacterized protein n=1 Tax=Moelleriella libera RCEF 2490 TaxID=1081109 RepID=A0A168AFE5_9HYPO|nr:hypothetical protein AAL_05581 [Moelleriella libera RCEF 2490]
MPPSAGPAHRELAISATIFSTALRRLYSRNRPTSDASVTTTHASPRPTPTPTTSPLGTMLASMLGVAAVAAAVSELLASESRAEPVVSGAVPVTVTVVAICGTVGSVYGEKRAPSDSGKFRVPHGLTFPPPPSHVQLLVW